jgi:hypothetical protein
MQNLLNALNSETNAKYSKLLTRIDDVKSVDDIERHMLDLLSNTQKQKINNIPIDDLKKILKAKLDKKKNKELESNTKVINHALEYSPEKRPELYNDEPVIINVEWANSKMWGFSPKASTFVSVLGKIESERISGCGSDKLSASVSVILNRIPYITYLLYKHRDNNIDDSLESIFGYGSGHGVLPYFESMVGVDCYPSILQKIGYDFKQVTSGKSFDVFSLQKGSA